MNKKRETGVVYQPTGEDERGQIHEYHRKPGVRDLNFCTPFDIKGIPKKQRSLVYQDWDNDTKCRFTIGFEVEKNSIHRGAIKEYPLFCGFERDSSCGYEAVTNILPLVPKSTWRNKVFNMFVEAEKVIDDRFSPSDEKNSDGSYKCGGHISVACKGYSGEDLREKVRKNVGIVYALFAPRLKNHYCCYNINMLNEYNSYIIGGTNGKYSAVYTKSNTLEFRIPSRVQSVRQLIRRYELMYELMDFSINEPDGKFSTLLKRVKPIIEMMYAGMPNAEQTVAKILRNAVHFRNLVLEYKVHQDIKQYLSPRHLRDIQYYWNDHPEGGTGDENFPENDLPY